MTRRELGNGLALGLWILAGLAFLVHALFPRSAGGDFLGPLLLAAAVGGTGGQSRGSREQRKTVRAPSRLAKGALRALGALTAAGVAAVIVREGDRRSWLAVGLTVALAFALSLVRPAAPAAPSPNSDNSRGGGR